jgi:predicted enzyme related to lactoylglutathione lyase
MPRPVHFEIHGDDPKSAARFYTEVFGWSFDRWGEQEYWLLGTGDEAPGIDGAVAPSQEHGQPVVLTMEVEDLGKYIAKVREAGGTVLLERAPIPGVGWLATATDPNGVLFGLMQPDPEAGG